MRLRAAVFFAATVLACSAPQERTSESSSATTVTAKPPARLLGINVDPRNALASPSDAELADAGGRAVRFTFKAGADLGEAFAAYDPEISRYASAGVRVLALLTQETLSRGGAWDDYVARFASRAKDIAAHYGSNVYAFEIWNEPDLDGAERHIDAPAYAQLLGASYDAIKSVSQAKVVTAGLASGQPSYVDAMGGFRADALSTHPYLQWFGAGVPDGWYSFENHLATFSRYGKPIWLTEWGTSDADLQPAYIQNVFDHVTGDARVAEAWFFAWSDSNHPGCGLTTDGATRKPAYATFQSYARAGTTPSTPAPPASAGGETDLTITNATIDAGSYLTQCNEDATAQRVWQATGAGAATFRYPENLTGPCGTPADGHYPIVFTGYFEGDLSGTYVTQCAGAGTALVFRVESGVNGHPAAGFLYPQSDAGCR